MFSCACRRLFTLRAPVASNNLYLPVANYKSAVSIQNLYPNSNPDSLTRGNPKATTGQDEEQFSGVIPLDKVKMQFCRSSGPGGQHVNKVNTKVEVRFNVDEASWIPDWLKPKIKEQQQNRINKQGELIVTSEKTRKQILNQADCLEKIRHMVFLAAVKPKEMTPEEIELRQKREEQVKQSNIAYKRRQSMLRKKKKGLW